MRLHHVQVACPPGGEGAARRFYADGLGLSEVEKPASLRDRGGVWFRAYAGGCPDGRVTAEIHVGVEEQFTPARKAHPAFVLDSVAQLDRVGSRLADLGYRVDSSQGRTLPGFERLHAFDGHGNRVELLVAS